MGTDKIDEGDIVKLKSGGPNMTVESLRDGDREECNVTWFAGRDLKHATLRCVTLRKHKGHKKS